MGWSGLRDDVRSGRGAAGRPGPLVVAAAVCSMLIVASGDRAIAADYPLRGSLTPSYARWDGWQFGLQAGLANMNVGFGNSTSGLVAFILRNTTIQNEFAPSDCTTLPSSGTNGQVYGAFLSYNWQWDQLVLGAELIYDNTASSLQSSARDSIGRQFNTTDGFTNQVQVTAESSVKLIDYALLRGRAGYAFGQFLPYATVGFALGRFNHQTTATVLSQGINTTTLATYGPNIDTRTAGKDNAFIGGVAAGLGVDWAITQSLFLRAEWQYLAFGPVGGIRTNFNTGQLGAGVRF